MAALPDPKIDGLDWTADYDLATATTMGVGGRADALAVAHSHAAVSQFLRRARGEAWRVWILGGGTNTIFCSERFAGVVLRLGREFARLWTEEGGRLCAGAAAPLSAVVKRAEREGLGGLEFCMGIPGQVGGALAGNAGQRGWAIGSLVETVRGLSLEGEPVELRQGEFEHGYRRSALSQILVCEARFLLKPCDRSAIRLRMQEFLSSRYEQPVGIRSSGCVFKNPVGDAAGRLIDAAGLKGCAIGGAVVAREHANFLTNPSGAAKAEEVVALIQHVRKTVYDRFGVELELEVRLVD